MQSLYFEDLRVGMRFESLLSEQITKDVVEHYALLTGDRLHKPLPSGGILVQGNFAVARAAGLLFDLGHFAETLCAQARKDTYFLAQLYVGECIRAVETITLVEDRSGKPYGRVDLEREVFKKSGELVHRSAQEYRIRKKMV